jgi:hypothetical protein
VPPIGEALGEERAWLRQHARATVADAERVLLDRYPNSEIQIDMCRAWQLAPQTRQDFGRGIYAGNVWLNAGGTLTQIAIRARFDGTVDWYWVLGE